MAAKTVDVICGERVTAGVAVQAGGGLWLSAHDLLRTSGWEFKPEGFCKGAVCMPVPPDRRADFVSGDSYNLAALAELNHQPALHDGESGVWCIGEAAENRRRALASLQAPDFTLPDLAGVPHSLSDYRGKKILLVSWASW
jgi:hypothetical protein